MVDAQRRYRSRLGLVYVFLIGPLAIAGLIAAAIEAVADEQWLLAAFPAVMAIALFVEVYFRNVIELEINGHELHWRAPFRRGAVQSREVTGAHPSWFRQSLVIEARNQQPVVAWRGPGLLAWLDRWGFIRPR
jgi:hypothetical protein